MATFGETLKRERELREISLREVSESTKIGLRYLEALEGNRFDQLPGGLFNKGFIRAYAKCVGLDGEALVNSYLYDLAHRRGQGPARPPYAGTPMEDLPLPAPVVKPKAAPRLLSGRILAMTMAGMVMLASGAWLIVSKRPSSGSPPIESGIATQASTEAAGLLHPARKPPEPETKPAEAAPPPTLETAPDLVAAEKPKKPAVAPVTTLGLFVNASEPTWISIRCGGVEKLKRDLAAGETVALSCDGDVLLSTGDAGALSLTVDGRECLPLGERGATLEDFLLNVGRAAEICPPEKGRF